MMIFELCSNLPKRDGGWHVTALVSLCTVVMTPVHRPRCAVTCQPPSSLQALVCQVVTHLHSCAMPTGVKWPATTQLCR